MPYIESHILPRGNIPIKNRYDIINNITNDDFHIVIYFIDSNNCNIIVRRLDEAIGWKQNLIIRIYNNINLYDDIVIGVSYDNYKQISAYTAIILEPINLNYMQVIPKVIIQTGPTHEMPVLKYNSIMTFIELNPEYEYKFFDDTASRKFIRTNFDEHILGAYDMLVPGAFKADLFRYCYLYINGGCYFDCKMILREPLRNFVDKKAELILCRDQGVNARYYNAIILSNKKLLNSTIVACVKNIYNNLITNDCLAITGPQLFYNSLDNKNKIVPMIHYINGHDWSKNYRQIGVKLINSNKVLLHKFYKGYYESIGDNHYSILNKKKEVYYKNKQIVDDWIIYVYPNSNKETFTFSIVKNWFSNDSVIVKHNGKNGWNFNLKIKLIDMTNDKEYVLVVGGSLVPTKHVHVVY